MTPRRDWIWVTPAVAIAAHAEQLVAHGGGEGVRALGLLESAMARPQNLRAYGDPDTPALAAAYAFRIPRAPPLWTVTNARRR